jgi:hypothetical protein
MGNWTLGVIKEACLIYVWWFSRYKQLSHNESKFLFCVKEIKIKETHAPTGKEFWHYFW